MNNRNNISRLGVLSLLFLMTGAVFCPAQELKKSGRYFVAEITKSFKVGKNGRVSVEDVRGDVDVTSWDKSEVLIHETIKMDVFTREEAETILEKSKSSYRQSGDNIEVIGESYRRDWMHSEFVISVPRSFSIIIDTRGGDISVGGITGSAELRTSGGNIDLNDIGGDIDAKTSGGNIELENCQGQSTLKTSGGNLTLTDIKGPLLAKTSGGDIRLRGAANGVEVRTSGGSIDISNVQGELSAQTSGGDIELADVNGDVSVHTSGGDVDFHNIGGALEASTSGGDIRGRGIQGNAEVSTSGGEIELEDVQGGVQGKTAGGDIDVEVTLKDFSKPHAVDLRTAGGAIKLSLPPKIPATIRAEIKLTNRWESYNIYSDFPLTSNDKSPDEDEDDGGRRGRRYITSRGDINGGGDLIELYTTDGDITIKKNRQ